MNGTNHNQIDDTNKSCESSGGGLFSRLGSMLFSYGATKPNKETEENANTKTDVEPTNYTNDALNKSLSTDIDSINVLDKSNKSDANLFDKASCSLNDPNQNSVNEDNQVGSSKESETIQTSLVKDQRLEVTKTDYNKNDLNSKSDTLESESVIDESNSNILNVGFSSETFADISSKNDHNLHEDTFEQQQAEQIIKISNETSYNTNNNNDEKNVSNKQSDETGISISKKPDSYNLDHFDDPNFNPFETKCAVRNSPEPERRFFDEQQLEEYKETQNVTEEQQNFDSVAESHDKSLNDKNCALMEDTYVAAGDSLLNNGFNESNVVDETLTNSTSLDAIDNSTSLKVSEEAVSTEENICKSNYHPEKEDNVKSQPKEDFLETKIDTMVLQTNAEKKSIISQNYDEPEIQDEIEIIVPKKSYNFDFDKFDDPNFNPFVTKSAVRNSPEPRDACNLESKELSIEKDVKTDDQEMLINSQSKVNCLSNENQLSTFDKDLNEQTDENSTVILGADDRLKVADNDSSSENNDLTVQDDVKRDNCDLSKSFTLTGDNKKQENVSDELDVCATEKVETSVDENTSIKEAVEITPKTENLDLNEPTQNPNVASNKDSMNLSKEADLSNGSTLLNKQAHNKEQCFTHENSATIEQDKNPNFDIQYKEENVDLTSKDPISLSNQNESLTDVEILKNETEDSDLIKQQDIEDSNLQEEIEVIVPKKSYNLDFDDPSFNPFATKAAVRNSPEICTKDTTTVQNFSEETSTEPVEVQSQDAKLEKSIDTLPKVNDDQNFHSSVNKKEVEENLSNQNSQQNSVSLDVNDPDVKKEEEIEIPKKSYNFDFDKFDDPNFNPFATKNAVCNSPEPKDVTNEVKEIPKPESVINSSPKSEVKKPLKKKPPLKNRTFTRKKKPEVVAKESETNKTEDKDDDEIVVPKKSYNFDFDKFDDPNFNPFATKNAVCNSPEPKSEAKQVQKEEPLIDSLEKTEVKKPLKKKPPLKNRTFTRKKKPEVVVKESETNKTEDKDDDEIVVPQKSYNFDFDKFDDPNFDPFATKTAVCNSPEPKDATSTVKNLDKEESVVEDLQITEEKPVKKKPPLKKKTLQKNKTFIRKKKPEIVAKESETSRAEDDDEIVVPKKSYNFDFDQFDDPNFNPFATKTAVRNSPEPKTSSVKMTDNGAGENFDENPPKIVSQLKQAEDDKTNISESLTDPTPKQTSELEGLKKPIPKRLVRNTEESKVVPMTTDFNDDPDFDPFKPKSAIRNSPPPICNQQQEFIIEAGDAPVPYGKESMQLLELQPGESAAPTVSLEKLNDANESLGSVFASSKSENIQNLIQVKVTGKSNQSGAEEIMSVDSLPVNHPDFVQPVATEPASRGLHCRDEQIKSASAFRPFASNRDEITASEKPLMARYELLMERKRRLKMTIRNNRLHKKRCETTSENLEELIKKKVQQTAQVEAEFRSKLDDYLHVRAQVSGFSNRETDIQKHIARMCEDNTRLQETLASRKSGYFDCYQKLVSQLDNDSDVINRLRSEQEAEREGLSNEFQVIDARLKKSQLQITTLEASLESKTKQCEEMGKLCDELFQSVELKQTDDT